MTIDAMIAKLRAMQATVGGDCEIRVLDAEGEWGFAMQEGRSDEGNPMVYLDITAEAE